MPVLLPTKQLYIKTCIRGNALQLCYYGKETAVSGWVANLVKSIPINFQVVRGSVYWWFCEQNGHTANVKPQVSYYTESTF
jgi:hypothetical protein